MKISKWFFAHIKASVCRTWHIHTNFSNSFYSVAPSGEYWTIITATVTSVSWPKYRWMAACRRGLENVVQCNGGNIEHVCWIEINDACALDLKSSPVLHFHSCNRPRPICLLSCYVLVIKFDVSECHNDVDLETVIVCPVSRYDTIRIRLTVNPSLLWVKKVVKYSKRVDLSGQPRIIIVRRMYVVYNFMLCGEWRARTVAVLFIQWCSLPL